MLLGCFGGVALFLFYLTFFSMFNKPKGVCRMQKKYLTNNKGFTLVEVIVVAVIVLILAAVAIPLYNGYINDSRLASVENVAGTVASGLGAAHQMGTLATNSLPAQTDGSIVIPGLNNNSNYIQIPKDMLVTYTDNDNAVHVGFDLSVRPNWTQTAQIKFR